MHRRFVLLFAVEEQQQAAQVEENPATFARNEDPGTALKKQFHVPEFAC